MSSIRFNEITRYFKIFVFGIPVECIPIVITIKSWIKKSQWNKVIYLLSSDISSLTFAHTKGIFPQIHISIKQVIIQVSTQSKHFTYYFVKQQDQIKNNVLRNSVVPDDNCNFTHFYWQFTFRLLHFHLYPWIVTWLTGNLYFGNLGVSSAYIVLPNFSFYNW